MALIGDQFCPDVLYGGGCKDVSSCLLKHDVKLCELCVVVCAPASNFDSHCAGQNHRASTASNASSVRPAKGQLRRCAVCFVTLHRDSWGEHLISVSHRKHQQLAALRAAYEQAEFDKQDVSISHAEFGVDFGIVGLDQAKGGVVTELNVSTKSSSQVSVLLTEVRSRVPNHGPLFTVTSIGQGLILTRGNPIRFAVHFRHSQLGRYEARLEFTFQGASQHPFVIARKLVAVVGESSEREVIKPVTPYIRARRAPWRDDLPVFPGRPPPTNPVTWARELPHFPVPAALAEALKAGSPEDIFARLREEYFPEPLSKTNHQPYFSTLLWIEEKRMTEDLRMYDMIGVEFIQEGRLWTLQVHGLSEKRPSIIIGDVIMVQAIGGGRSFKGIVHDVRQDAVRVHFHEAFDGGGRNFNVIFQLNRTILRRQHQALGAKIPSPQRLLFPAPGQEGLEKPLEGQESRLGLFNSSIGTNVAQMQAVTSILNIRDGSAPLILFGPPGTGKTVTIVEAIHQILQVQPRARILACAPSNSAADILAQRLITLNTEELFRCNAATRDPSSVPPEVVPYTHQQGNFYALPSLDTLTKYKVIVSTCINASFAYNIGIPEGHFTHIFVDEAGQASEPEVLVAIKPLALEHTRVILSGDPKQLGPVIHSSTARDFEMGTSYLERLMALPIYSDASGRGTAYAKLTKNYRSHSAILSFPNEQFYDGDLEVCGAPAIINSFLGSPQLVSPRFPVVFHAISGKNEREASSPSYFNVDEAVQAKAIIRSLLQDRGFPINARDIGVITPYHAQVRKIRRLLHDVRGLEDVKVGSVEEFQGQERRVIIVSTVRSSTDLLAYDAKFTLGFLANARRFNVAMTRAQALLIVIGDAAILSVDPLWRAFMNYVYLHDGWRGDAPTWDVHAPVLTDADYMEELREAISAEMNGVMAQLLPEEDVEAEANVDKGFWTNDGDATDW